MDIIMDEAQIQFKKTVTGLNYIIGSCHQKEQLKTIGESVHRLLDPYKKFVGNNEVAKAKSELFLEINELESTCNYD